MGGGNHGDDTFPLGQLVEYGAEGHRYFQRLRASSHHRDPGDLFRNIAHHLLQRRHQCHRRVQGVNELGIPAGAGNSGG